MHTEIGSLKKGRFAHFSAGRGEQRGRKWMTLVATLAVATASILGVDAGAASAVTPPPIANDLADQEGVIADANGSLVLDPAIIDGAHVDLKAAGFPVRLERVNGVDLETFTLPDGTEFSFSTEGATPVVGQKNMSPMLGGGINRTGLYISFNRLDQQAIIGGAGAAIATAICFIPAVGVPACVAAAAVVAAATVYLTNAGLCANGDELFVYVNLLGYPECQ